MFDDTKEGMVDSLACVSTTQDPKGSIVFRVSDSTNMMANFGWYQLDSIKVRHLVDLDRLYFRPSWFGIQRPRLATKYLWLWVTASLAGRGKEGALARCVFTNLSVCGWTKLDQQKLPFHGFHGAKVLTMSRRYHENTRGFIMFFADSANIWERAQVIEIAMPALLVSWIIIFTTNSKGCWLLNSHISILGSSHGSMIMLV